MFVSKVACKGSGEETHIHTDLTVLHSLTRCFLVATFQTCFITIHTIQRNKNITEKVDICIQY